MCNRYRRRGEPGVISEAFADLRIPLRFPEGAPNFRPGDVAITDHAPIGRLAPDGAAELVQRRWSWPGAGGKPVYNFRSEGRDLSRGRCLIFADGFYEYTANADPKAKRKHQWLFTMPAEPVFAIAGLWRTYSDQNEAFTMLTIAPGPDVAPYHNRQIVPLPPSEWRRWLDAAVPAVDVLRPSPVGTLQVEQVA